MNRLLLTTALGLVLLASCTSGQPQPKPAAGAVPGIQDSSLGLSKTSVFDVPAPKPVEYITAEPGKGQLVPRAYPGAPPVIPHAISDYLPISRDENACQTCHAVTERKPGEPTPIPPSHYIDWRNAPTVTRQQITGSRWVCTSCHVPQARVEPLVGNTFAH